MREKRKKNISVFNCNFVCFTHAPLSTKDNLYCQNSILSLRENDVNCLENSYFESVFGRAKTNDVFPSDATNIFSKF